MLSIGIALVLEIFLDVLDSDSVMTVSTWPRGKMLPFLDLCFDMLFHTDFLRQGSSVEVDEAISSLFNTSTI